MPAKKKSAPKKGSQKKNTGKPDKKVNTVKKYQRSLGMKIAPYIFCILAIILAVCFILVAIDGSAGSLGFGMQAFFRALFGGAAYALPPVLGYIGVRWCIFNIRWHESSMKSDSEDHVDYVRAKRTIKLAAAMTVLVFILASAFIGVTAEQSSFSLSDFWSDGWDGEGGGIIGGSLGCLMFVCFDTVLSIVILCILFVIFIPLALGITPNYILSKIRDRHAVNAAQRAEDKKMLAEREAEERKARPTVAVSAPAVSKHHAKEKSVSREVSVDELLSDSPKTSPTPVKADVQKEFNASDVRIAPSDSEIARTEKPAEAEKTKTESGTPLDFGGDSGFDRGEFDNIDNIIKGLDTPIAPTPAPADTLEKAPSPVPPSVDISQMSGEALLEDMAEVAPDDTGETTEVIAPYVFPPVDFLTANKDVDTTDHTEELQSNAKVLVETLRSFRVGVKEVTYSRGPTITRYELKPEVGTRVRSIANLVDDIALNLATSGVRIEAPIPGKAAVGIEVPNQTRATVYLRDLIDNPKFTDSKSKLTAALGMDVGGNPIHFDIAKMPHLLIAGTTGSGKSICINCIIMSILYKAKPEEGKLILIDPKKVEFNMYKGIPHLYCPIVSEPKKAAGALSSAVAEMERRFELIEQAGVRDIGSYNAAAENDPELEFMPHMVIIIDELADLMMTARDEVETSICRIAQKARAAGIHMILGTQRPSVDVITGLIKANVPSRIACTVMSQVDSRTIIDVAGAENLIGRGDMLFAPVGASKPIRVQGAFVSENEIEKIVDFVKENNGEARYNTDFINKIEEEAAKCGMGKKGAAAEYDGAEPVGGDTKFADAVKIAIESGKISTSLLQRRIGIGYGRAAKIIDRMQEMGYVSAPDGNKPRNVLITMEEYMRRISEGSLGDE